VLVPDMLALAQEGRQAAEPAGRTVTGSGTGASTGAGAATLPRTVSKVSDLELEVLSWVPQLLGAAAGRAPGTSATATARRPQLIVDAQ
jgi:hypothetical protein